MQKNIFVHSPGQCTWEELMQAITAVAQTPADLPLAFSAFGTREADTDTYNIVIHIHDAPLNTYSPFQLAVMLTPLMNAHKDVAFVQAPLEHWLRAFSAMRESQVWQAYRQYSSVITDKDEYNSLWYFAVTTLYNKGYYLHQSLVYKAFMNELYHEIRQVRKAFNEYREEKSLDELQSLDEDGQLIPLVDTIASEDDDDEDLHEYWHEMYEKIKGRMLQDMSPLSFDRILLQLSTNTVDRSTSYKLDKYRQIFNPGYTPRPNARGKNKGGKKC